MKTFLVTVLALGCLSYIFGETSNTDISCSYYQRKSVQQRKICSIRASPLCASNNVTYPNSCVYCFADIALNFTLQIQHNGKCHKPVKVL